MIIFGTNMRLSMHIDDNKTEIIISKIIIRNTLILGKGPIDGYMTIRWLQRKIILIKFTMQQNKFCLSLHYNGVNSYLLVNDVKIFKFKPKYSEIQHHCVWVMFQKIFQLIIWIRLDYMDMFTIFQLILIILMLMIF